MENTLPARKPNRFFHYDYSSGGFYFITVCCDEGKHLFGEITEEKMELNNCGSVVEKCIAAIPEHYKNISVQKYIIMPNHMHLILSHNARAGCILPLQNRSAQVVPVVVGTLKAAVTRKINALGIYSGFKWQRSYYDHIIRDEMEFERIYTYIENNPLKWHLDAENNIVKKDKTQYYKEIIGY